MQDTELLKAAMAVAVADGAVQRSEKGLLEGLARRVGLGSVSYEAMLEAARQDPDFTKDLFLPQDRARRTLELLVGLARIDGMISDEERKVIVEIASALGVSGAAFEQVYLDGVKRADELRRSRRPAPE